MNRVIKFRGRSKLLERRWVYGSYNQEKGTIDTGNQVLEVYENSVGQYTGLHDRKKREIYEGDIFTIGGKYTKVIAFNKHQLAFDVINVKDFEMRIFHHPDRQWWKSFRREIKVIGNVYDNPELLEMTTL